MVEIDDCIVYIRVIGSANFQGFYKGCVPQDVHESASSEIRYAKLLELRDSKFEGMKSIVVGRFQMQFCDTIIGGACDQVAELGRFRCWRMSGVITAWKAKGPNNPTSNTIIATERPVIECEIQTNEG